MLLLFGTLGCIELGVAQLPCDSTAYVGGNVGNFDRIFGGHPEPWQVCGDTIHLKDWDMIYSYPQCRVWVVRKDGKIKWSADLRELNACKLIAIIEVNKEPSRPWKHVDVLVQASDKRVFGFSSKNGRITLIPPEAQGKKQ